MRIIKNILVILMCGISGSAFAGVGIRLGTGTIINSATIAHSVEVGIQVCDARNVCRDYHEFGLKALAQLDIKLDEYIKIVSAHISDYRAPTSHFSNCFLYADRTVKLHLSPLDSNDKEITCSMGG